MPGGQLPCSEERARAAISWMVSARRDLGSISTVSSTLTCQGGHGVTAPSRPACPSRVMGRGWALLGAHPAGPGVSMRTSVLQGCAQGWSQPPRAGRWGHTHPCPRAVSAPARRRCSHTRPYPCTDTTSAHTRVRPGSHTWPRTATPALSTHTRARTRIHSPQTGPSSLRTRVNSRHAHTRSPRTLFACTWALPARAHTLVHTRLCVPCAGCCHRASSLSQARARPPVPAVPLRPAACLHRPSGPCQAPSPWPRGSNAGFGGAQQIALPWQQGTVD